MTIPTKVVAALTHVREHYPEVVQVFYGIDGRWQFVTADFDAPTFGDQIDIALLEDAADSLTSLPAAFALEPTVDL